MSGLAPSSVTNVEIAIGNKQSTVNSTVISTEYPIFIDIWYDRIIKRQKASNISPDISADSNRPLWELIEVPLTN